VQVLLIDRKIKKIKVESFLKLDQALNKLVHFYVNFEQDGDFYILLDLLDEVTYACILLVNEFLCQNQDQVIPEDIEIVSVLFKTFIQYRRKLGYFYKDVSIFTAGEKAPQNVSKILSSLENKWG
jgi:hypothetical protein